MPGKSRKFGRRVLSREQRYARESLAQFRKTPPELVKDIRPFLAYLWDKLRHNGVLVKDLMVGPPASKLPLTEGARLRNGVLLPLREQLVSPSAREYPPCSNLEEQLRGTDHGERSSLCSVSNLEVGTTTTAGQPCCHFVPSAAQ